MKIAIVRVYNTRGQDATGCVIIRLPGQRGRSYLRGSVTRYLQPTHPRRVKAMELSG